MVNSWTDNILGQLETLMMTRPGINGSLIDGRTETQLSACHARARHKRMSQRHLRVQLRNTHGRIYDNVSHLSLLFKMQQEHLKCWQTDITHVLSDLEVVVAEREKKTTIRSSWTKGRESSGVGDIDGLIYTSGLRETLSGLYLYLLYLLNCVSANICLGNTHQMPWPCYSTE